MKRFIYVLSALLSALFGAACLSACTDDNEPFKGGVETESDCFTLVVKVPFEASSRADDEADADASRAVVTELNEFKVRTVHFYFYPIDGHDDETSKSVYDCEWTEEFDTQKTVSLVLPSNSFLPGGIFGTSGTTCIVYAVANVELPQGTAKTINELKRTPLNSDFNTTTEAQASFAMDGFTDKINVDRDARTATGNIVLYRAAAKLTLSVNIPSSITVTNTIINQDGTTSEGTERTYTSHAADMRVWISNGVKNSLLNTEPVVATKDDLYSNEIAPGTGVEFTFNDAMEKYKYIQNVPFYSYPNKWDSTTPYGNSYLTLLVPWTYTDDDNATQKVTSYYRLAVNPENCNITRNTHYDMRVTIGRLGSTSAQEPTDMKLEWNYAIPWNHQTLETDIKGIRYLLLNNNYYDQSIVNPDKSKGAYSFDMNNTTDIDITFGTSHEVEIASVTLTWHDFLNDVDRQLTLTPNGTYKYSNLEGYTDATDNTVYAGIEIDNAASRLKLSRKMLHIGYMKYEWKEAQWEKYDTKDLKWVPIDHPSGDPKVEERLIAAHYEWVESTEPMISDFAAINAYRFDIVLQHKDGHGRKANVRITQYPDIFITAQNSEFNTLFVNDNYDDYGDRHRLPNDYYVYSDGEDLTYAYTNSQRPEGTAPTEYYYWDYYMGSIEDPSKYESTNTNSYIINLSRISDTSEDYIIGDPRTRTVNNLPRTDSEGVPKAQAQDSASWSSPDVNGKQLSNYYPTDGTDSRQRFIAPKLRVASQLGRTQNMIFDAAKRRCASYQEDGRPAGRWRLPTIAEIEYLARLSNSGFIPYLFGSNAAKPSTYFCGKGVVKVDNRKDNPTVIVDESLPQTTMGYVRCVYDEWYWDTDTLVDKTKFTWGDRQRSISGDN